MRIPPPGPLEYDEGIPRRAARPGDHWHVGKDPELGWYAEPRDPLAYAIWPTMGLPKGIDPARFRKRRHYAKSWAAAMTFVFWRLNQR